jgi:hypothetical protein
VEAAGVELSKTPLDTRACPIPRWVASRLAPLAPAGFRAVWQRRGSADHQRRRSYSPGLGEQLLARSVVQLKQGLQDPLQVIDLRHRREAVPERGGVRR